MHDFTWYRVILFIIDTYFGYWYCFYSLFLLHKLLGISSTSETTETYRRGFTIVNMGIITIY